ncbi:MAG: type III pantothenate kinase [Lachnospiraceae bacterium]|nr:type III pantothenate kinase [Lachnospiraceae bacterium]
MILVVDVGNTNINFGVYDKETPVVRFKVMSKLSRTSDEFGILICDLLKLNNVDRNDITGAIVASVVPNVMHALTNALERYLKTKPLIVGPGVKTGIKIITENPREIGADRIVDAVAAYELYGGPVLVLDFGTATTYDLVTKDGCFAAGITAPGIRISAKALWEDTAKLPEIEIKKPASILAQETVSSMQAGLVYGQIGQAEYIIKKVKEETGYKDLKVIATGGLGSIVSDETDAIDVYDRNLTMEGLRLIYEKNRNATEKRNGTEKPE